MRVIVSGGGTGGHIYPALALIQRLIETKEAKKSEILYVGTKRGLESRIVPEQGISFTSIEIQGFRRSLSLQNAKTVALFLKSIRRSKNLIREFKPDIVIGTGGYVSSAVVYAAARLHIPTVIHEQNSIAGVTNKFLGHFVNKIAISFPDAAAEFSEKKKIVLTGNPRAQQVAGIQANDRLTDFGLQKDVPTLLIFGGSRGAEPINQAFINAFDDFAKRAYQVLFVTGKVHFDRVKTAIGSRSSDNIVIQDYIGDMPNILADITAIVGRAGATSIAEITALGLPSILIPSPYVTHDHQTKNAESLVKSGAALMLKEDQLSERSLLRNADTIMQDAILRKSMMAASKTLGQPNAADQLIQVMTNLVKQTK
ncbi:undecaprenyldiphospho-muramoylpentapeptide beta-N-acetylglucosaminyltransferase [Agrilactobacillus fermenti]|uniref:undecaprenyldiphospho-muramoylpentapeptide beta-N-acetylglucosaminyltransferase n=1 Tax=Agrilactobacillus fermenti TaxID=2586909 RepID=UPI001E3D02D8|nr:undecaprenyldiphospho-muramoylpentapeptide beta-N-acetylglucosaminyltransferase [Agrilactobacillus fermenti]MCD2255312.1 undecaprenyldiphospho-muramoylpentapeptide beta-N-acetylglucosaminyltransferase [Agrilactobacillus fermenti]